MIWYTYKAATTVVNNQFVQISNDGQTVEPHTTGEILGLCINVETLEDTQEKIAKVYTAGGSGQDAILNTDWDGAPTRFTVVNGKVSPISSGGLGWIIPVFPQTSKQANELVKVAIY